ncbi:MAG: phosphotransferase [Anaerolineales bacterium]|jgi:homoserine kinase type II
MPTDPAVELRDVLQRYDLGQLVGLERNERGYVNTSFVVDVDRQGVSARYFVRKYKKGINESDVRFEHSVINRLVAAGSPPVARLHLTQNGSTYLHRFSGEDRKGDYFAIFDFLPDEDRYTWVGPRCLPKESRSSAIVQAQFHKAMEGFQPEGQREEPRILDLLQLIATRLATAGGRSKHTVFDAYLEEHLELLERDLSETLEYLQEPPARALPQVVIHCDYHPGNLKFRGSEVTGVFDFDWSKLDLRAFDVGLALWYFYTSWDGEHDGELRLEDVAIYLGAYQQYMYGRPGLGPLSAQERVYLPYLINAGNLYILYWTVEDYFNKAADPQEYLVYLRHSVNFTKWIRAEGNLDALRVTLSQLPGSEPR